MYFRLGAERARSAGSRSAPAVHPGERGAVRLRTGPADHTALSSRRRPRTAAPIEPQVWREILVLFRFDPRIALILEIQGAIGGTDLAPQQRRCTARVRGSGRRFRLHRVAMMRPMRGEPRRRGDCEDSKTNQDISLHAQLPNDTAAAGKLGSIGKVPLRERKRFKLTRSTKLR